MPVNNNPVPGVKKSSVASSGNQYFSIFINLDLDQVIQDQIHMQKLMLKEEKEQINQRNKLKANFC